MEFKNEKGKIIKQTLVHGYLYVRINGKRKAVHRLVAQAFIPNPENKPEVNHLNGIKTDNRVENLEWCTHTENIRHAFSTGLSNANHLRKVTFKQAEEIRALDGKLTHKEIGKIYGIARQTVDYIILSKNYKHE